MARQDIFATLSDDVLGEKCSTSSMRGKVKEITLWVNTDCCGEMQLRFSLDDNKKLICEILSTQPDKVEIKK